MKTMVEKITIMFMNEPQLEILIHGGKAESRFLQDKVSMLVPVWLYPDVITLKHVNMFIESRVPSKERADIDFILKKYGVPAYNPYWLCSKSHGQKVTDYLWVKFNDEEVNYDDIRIR